MEKNIVTLPTWLLPKSKCEAIRVGSKHDGGYVIDSISIRTTKYLLSFGIGENFDFENQWLTKDIYRICSFDGSISMRYFAKQIIKYIFLFPLAPNRLFYYLYKASSFGNFILNKKVYFYNKYISIDNRINSLKFENAISELPKLKEREVFLKIDIEGGEYRILENIINHQKYFSGIAIEFHDFDLHKSRIHEFIAKLQMSIVAINVNNSAPILQLDTKKFEPSVIEVTFTPFNSENKPNNWYDKITKNNPCNNSVQFIFE